MHFKVFVKYLAYIQNDLHYWPRNFWTSATKFSFKSVYFQCLVLELYVMKFQIFIYTGEFTLSIFLMLQSLLNIANFLHKMRNQIINKTMV